MLTCKYPDCGSLKIENKDSMLCSVHNRLSRKPVKELVGKTNILKAKKLKAIAKVSKGMKIKLTEYSYLRKQFLIDNPQCAVFPELKSETVHHKKGRIGDLLCDVRYWLPTSFKAHTYIEEHPEWAYENGYSLKRNGNEKI